MKRLICILAALMAGFAVSAIALESPPTFTGPQSMFVVGSVTEISTNTLADAHHSQFCIAKPTFNPQLFFSAPATASVTSQANAIAISTTTLVAATSTWLLSDGGYTDIIVPRNISASVTFAAGIATTTVTGKLTVNGLDQFGVSMSEDITLSTNTANGVKAWSTVTSVVWTITAITGRLNTGNALLNLGTGVKIGLPAVITDSNMVLKVIENNALSTTYTLDKTYYTITFASAPNGSQNYTVYCKPQKR